MRPNTFINVVLKTLNFKIICETVDQNGYKWWGEFTRSETEMVAGVGTALIVDGTGIYKNLINECA